jgi:hypothetical protein
MTADEGRQSLGTMSPDPWRVPGARGEVQADPWPASTAHPPDQPDDSWRPPARGRARPPSDPAGPVGATPSRGRASWADPRSDAGSYPEPVPTRRSGPARGERAGTHSGTARRRRRGRRRATGAAAHPPRLAHLPYLVVLVVSAAGLAWMWHGGPQRTRAGTLAVSGALLVAALARLVLPEARAGMLASRGRFMDVVTLAALAIGLLAVGLVLPTPS